MKKKNIYWILALHFIWTNAMSQHPSEKMTFEQYVRQNIPTTEEIDVFLHDRSWVQFDGEVGYILGDYMPQDGVDGSLTISTVEASGARTSFMYKDQPCRINTYGNSFTAGNQVSDGETWQEYLAAHLGEPIRNFGVGGFGVYQSYRRMIREERTGHAADYNILYIWGDDHFRSLLRSRYMVTTAWNDGQDEREGVGKMFHGNFWSNVEMDLHSGQFVEKENLLPTPESLYNMCDSAWMVENLRDDWALHIRLYLDHRIDTIDVGAMTRLAEWLGHELGRVDGPDFRASLDYLLDKYSYAATKYILGKAKGFAEMHGKKLLVVLFDPYGTMRQMLAGEDRGDQEIVDFLEAHGFVYFDMNLVHIEDFKDFNLTTDQYFRRYFIGHYNPTGSHFFAHAIKQKMVQWLDPKPVPYLGITGKSINFEGYLKGYKRGEH